MTIEMIPLNRLRPSKGNPRKSFDEESIKGLAQSILADGLLQNLVAAKPESGKRKYDIISGERRYRAFTLLIEQGHFPKNVAVPCEIKDGLSAQDTLRIATMENVQRQNLTPLDEAQAIATLVHEGDSLADIISKTGLSDSTIKRRMVLLDLSDKVKAALTENAITLSQAEAFTVGTHDEQDDILEQVKSGWYNTAAEIKDRLICELPTLAMAIFPKKQYSGEYTTDLFGSAETTYFNDPEQFYELQKSAAEKMVADLDKENDWAALVEGRFSSVEYTKAKKGQSGGVVVCLTSEGKVDVHKGLIRAAIDESVSTALRAPKATYAKTVRAYIAMQKSAAVQAELIRNPRRAREIGVAAMLYRSATHGCLSYLDELEEDSPHLDIINNEAAALLALVDSDEESLSFRTLLRYAYSAERAYDLVQLLDDQQLDRLFAFLSAIAFGQEDTEELDTREHSLFNRVACDLGVDMRDYWMPGQWFLSRRTMKQLQPIIKETGMNRLFGNGGGFKKTDLVRLMVSYFRKVRAFRKPAPDQKQARDWLPEVIAFPAIDPDKLPDQLDEQAASELKQETLAKAA